MTEFNDCCRKSQAHCQRCKRRCKNLRLTQSQCGSLTKIDDDLEILRMLEAPIRQHWLDAQCHVNFGPRNDRIHGCKDVSKRMTQEVLSPNKPDRLGHLPLALDQMASCILETDCTIASFQQMYSDWELANRLPCTTAVNIYIYNKSVAAALALSLETLSDITGSTMSLLAFFDPNQVPEELLSDSAAYIPCLSNPIVREEVFRDLRIFSLITRNPEKKTVTIRRLVRDASIRSLGVNADKMQLAFDNALYLLCQMFPKQSPSRDHMTETWTDCETYVRHVISLHERYIQIAESLAVQPSMEVAELLYHDSWYVCAQSTVTSVY